MGEVTLTINGKNYGISCDEGQEQRVIDLAFYVDTKVKEMLKAGAANSESHALVLASLIIADESFDLMENATTSKAREGQAPEQPQRDTTQDDAALASTIDQLADRIDAVADKMKTAA